MQFPDFHSVEQFLDSLVNYEQTFPLGGPRDRPKLAPTLCAVARLGLPLQLPSCVHIAGTKGKGSVVTFLECLLSSDRQVLSFSSPHLVSVKERVRLNGRLLDDEVWKGGFEEITRRLEEAPSIKLTYFEVVWVFYLWASQRLQSEVNIVEAGLGGMWDATNVLKETIAVLSLVDYDHTEILGSTLTEIATDKSGIIKPGAQVIVGRQPEEALRVYEARVAEEGTHAQIFAQDFGWTSGDDAHFRYWDQRGEIDSLTLGLSGTHQRDNAALAICTARTLFPGLDPSAIRERLMQCTIPGRQELLAGSPPVLLDVAHNPVSFKVLAETLRQRCAGKRIVAVVGMMKNKDALGSLSELKGLVQKLLIVELHNPRSFKQDELRDLAQSLGFAVECPSSEEAAFVQLHSDVSHDLGLVAGSFYLAGDYLIWRQRAGIA